MTTQHTNTQVNEGIRKSLDPSILVSYLPIGDSFTTDTLVAATWTKVLISTTSKKLTNWAIVDTGSGDYRYQFQDDETQSFRLGMTTGLSSAVLDNEVEFSMSNGTIGVDQDNLETGIYTKSKTKTANDISPLGLEGYFTIDPLDTIAVWVKSEKATEITFIGMSIVIIEVN